MRLVFLRVGIQIPEVLTIPNAAIAVLEELVQETEPNLPLVVPLLNHSAVVSRAEPSVREVSTAEVISNHPLELAILKDQAAASTIPTPILGSFVPLDELVVLDNLTDLIVVPPIKLATDKLEPASLLQEQLAMDKHMILPRTLAL